jgi:DNA-binding MarR family transcriptional regulator
MTRLDFGILLGLAYQGFVDRLREALAAEGFGDLGGAFGFVFRALDEAELSQRELALRLGISDQGMAKILEEMRRKRYLERYSDPADGRVKRFRLAPRGRRALAVARRFHDADERRLSRTLGAEAVGDLRRMLSEVAGIEEDPKVAYARLRAI